MGVTASLRKPRAPSSSSYRSLSLVATSLYQPLLRSLASCFSFFALLPLLFCSPDSPVLPVHTHPQHLGVLPVLATGPGAFLSLARS